ncbi:hypothetical protein FOL47_006899 [Perkinsus chesapeaki]|uniref:Uncharacterized protein n=1 Tax=Perkinsus chesapeaki TaxID=330153 RepID=A0A7J6LNS6_PERCH|nr:hypothetical protein FOL47_006899 [Perkinsus chesapeaki]
MRHSAVGECNGRVLDATGRPRMDCFQPPDSRPSIRPLGSTDLQQGAPRRPPKPTTRPPPMPPDPQPRPLYPTGGEPSRLEYHQGRHDGPGGSSNGWIGRQEAATSGRYDAVALEGTREPSPTLGQPSRYREADYYYYEDYSRPDVQRPYGGYSSREVPATSSYYSYTGSQPSLDETYRRAAPVLRGIQEPPPPPYSHPSVGGYSEYTVESDRYSTTYEGPRYSYASSAPRPPPPPQPSQYPYTDDVAGYYDYREPLPNRRLLPEQQRYERQQGGTIPIRQNLNSEIGGGARDGPRLPPPPQQSTFDNAIYVDRHHQQDGPIPGNASQEDRQIPREKGTLSPLARSPQQMPPDFEPEADVPCQADLDSVRHKVSSSSRAPAATRREEFVEDTKPPKGQLGPSRLDTIPEKPAKPAPPPSQPQDKSEEEDLPELGLTTPRWPEGYHPPEKRIPSGIVRCVYSWPHPKLGQTVAKFINFTRQLLPCDGEYLRLPHSGVLWKTRALEPVGIAVTMVRASEEEKEENTYVDFWGQRIAVKVAVLKAEKVDKAWVAALEKSRSCPTITDEKIQELELAIPAHIEIIQKGLFKGEDGSQIRGDRENFPLFNEFLRHLERFGRGGRIKDPFRDSRPTEDRRDDHRYSRPTAAAAGLLRSDNASETVLFEQRARLWDTLSKYGIDEANSERFSCVLCKNGCQGLGQLIEHVTSRAHTSTAVLFPTRDAIMTLPLVGSTDNVVKFDVKSLKHWTETAAPTGANEQTRTVTE